MNKQIVAQRLLDLIDRAQTKEEMMLAMGSVRLAQKKYDINTIHPNLSQELTEYGHFRLAEKSLPKRAIGEQRHICSMIINQR